MTSAAVRGVRAPSADTFRERPFVLLAVVLLADPLQLLLELPPDDVTRRAAIKARFTCVYLRPGGTEDRGAAGPVVPWRPGRPAASVR